MSEYDEKRIIMDNFERCMKAANGNVSKASKMLGIDRRTIQRRVRKLTKRLDFSQKPYNSQNIELLL